MTRRQSVALVIMDCIIIATLVAMILGAGPHVVIVLVCAAAVVLLGTL